LTGMPMSTLLWAGETLHRSRCGGPAELETGDSFDGQSLFV
jgi:hypothetical protein